MCMKIFLFTFFILILCSGLHAQSLNCLSFRNGKFKMTINGHTSVIERSGSNQKEYFINLKDSLKMSFNVKWLDDCTYTLTPTKESFEKYPQIPKNAVLTVQITSTTANSYTQSSTSNFIAKTVVGEVIKIN
jgi:hypothetical protein